LVKHKYSI